MITKTIKNFQVAANIVTQKLVNAGDKKARRAYDGTSLGYGQYVLTSNTENVGEEIIEQDGTAFKIKIILDTFTV